MIRFLFISFTWYSNVDTKTVNDHKPPTNHRKLSAIDHKLPAIDYKLPVNDYNHQQTTINDQIDLSWIPII